MTQSEQTPKQVLEETLREVARGYPAKNLDKGTAPTATERMRAALALKAIGDRMNYSILVKIINGPTDKQD